MDVIGRRYEREGIHVSDERYLVGAEIVEMSKPDRDIYNQFLRYGGNDAGAGAGDDDGGGLNAIEHLVSGGVSFLRPFGRPNDQAGVGLSWTHPVDTDFRDEYAAEVYYRLQVTEGLEVSGSAQLILDPSANPDHDAVGVFGLRVRLLY